MSSKPSLLHNSATVAHLSAALSFSAPWVYTAMDQSTQRANPSFSRSSVMLPFCDKRGTLINYTENLNFYGHCCEWVSASASYGVKDGAQDDLVGAALQDDLHVPLQKTRLGEEFGLCCERLWWLCTICFPLECRTLQEGKKKKKTTKKKESNITIILKPQSTAILQEMEACILSTAIPSSQPVVLKSFFFFPVHTLFWYNLHCVLPLSSFNWCHLAVHAICILLLSVAKHQTDINTPSAASRQAF